jgi:hypothetical protein
MGKRIGDLWTVTVYASMALLVGWMAMDPAASGECPYAEPPPAQYDFPFPGRLEEYSGDRAFVEQHCSRAFLQAGAIMPPYTIGCAYEVINYDDGSMVPAETFSVIIYLAGCENIRRHEVGHTNGWVHQ